MKTRLVVMLAIFSLFIVSCGGNGDSKEKEKIKIGDYSTKNTSTTAVKETPKTDVIDLSNNGIGPIKNLELDATIDQAMVVRGEDLFKSKCTACHKPTKKFIGPSPVGLLDRRSPAWIMNMILNPEEMTQKDPIARQLLIDYNGSPMANQSLTETEARDILEYFRTLIEE